MEDTELEDPAIFCKQGFQCCAWDTNPATKPAAYNLFFLQVCWDKGGTGRVGVASH